MGGTEGSRSNSDYGGLQSTDTEKDDEVGGRRLSPSRRMDWAVPQQNMVEVKEETKSAWPAGFTAQELSIQLQPRALR